jgi:branched-chain amino acid transport system substrate-binding protein
VVVSHAELCQNRRMRTPMAPLSALLSVFVFGAGLVATMTAQAENGVTDDKIVIGLTTNLTDQPTSQSATDIKRGADLVFNKVNAGGGIFSRKITSILYNDSGKTERAVENAKKLATEDQVFTLFELFNTSAADQLLPFLKTSGVPFLFPNSGAAALRRPTLPNIYCLRMSYGTETESLVSYLVETRGMKSIAILYQDGAQSTELRNAVKAALQKRGLKPKAEGLYSPNLKGWDTVIKDFEKKKVTAINLAVTAKVAVSFVKAVRAKKLDWTFSGGSLLDDAFVKEAGSALDGSILSQSFPPSESAIPLVKTFKADMQAAGIKEASLEGYLNALVFVEGLKRVGRELTRKAFIKAFDTMGSVDFGGLYVTFSEQNHEGLTTPSLVEIRGGKRVPIR